MENKIINWENLVAREFKGAFPTTAFAKVFPLVITSGFAVFIFKLINVFGSF